MRIWAVVGLLVLGCGGSDSRVSSRSPGTGGNDAGASTGGADASASRSGGSPGTGGRPECKDGAETCACYGNGTCNAGLVCASNLCVRLNTGAGGAGAGGAGAGGRSPFTGGVPSTGGAPPIPGSSPLGGRCVQNVDCRAGLTCLTSSSNALGNGGPPGGLCTSPCLVNDDCIAFDPNTICVGFSGTSFCLERCVMGGTSIAKCHGRADLVCAGLVDDAGNPTTESACLPQCNSDSDCRGRRCDYRTGYCADAPAGTLPIGSPCNPNASTDQCNGVCTDFYADTGVPYDPRYGVCVGLCSLSYEGFGCGVDATTSTPFDASCLGPATSAIGDPGICFQLCDCDRDCRNTAFVCRPWTDPTSAGATGHQGYCGGPLDDQGLIVPNLPCGP